MYINIYMHTCVYHVYIYLHILFPVFAQHFTQQRGKFPVVPHLRDFHRSRRCCWMGRSKSAQASTTWLRKGWCGIPYEPEENHRKTVGK